MSQQFKSIFKIHDYIHDIETYEEVITKPHLIKRVIEKENNIRLEKITQRLENKKMIESTSISIEEFVKISDDEMIPIHNSVNHYRQVASV